MTLTTDSRVYTFQKSLFCHDCSAIFRARFLHDCCMRLSIVVGSRLAPFWHICSCFSAIVFQCFVVLYFYGFLSPNGSQKQRGANHVFLTFSILLPRGVFWEAPRLILAPSSLKFASFWHLRASISYHFASETPSLRKNSTLQGHVRNFAMSNFINQMGGERGRSRMSQLLDVQKAP